MAYQVVDGTTEEGKKHLIQPKNINTAEHFWEAFGSCKTEKAANIVVRLCQKKGGWVPFTLDDIMTFSGIRFCFMGLNDISNPKSDKNLIILGEDGQYRVTSEFIDRCYKASPVK